MKDLRILPTTLFDASPSSQAEIFWRARWVFDRQEVLDVLKYSVEMGWLVPQVFANVAGIELATFEEEKRICWKANINADVHWFQIA